MTDLDATRQRLNLMSNEELGSILQQRDYSEWRPEVFDLARSILNQRGIAPGALPSEEASAGASLEVPERLELVTVASYTSYLDAETDRLALENKGLKVWIFDEYSPLAEGMNPGMRLQVCAEDVAAAMETLNAEPIPSSEIPDEIAEPPCPKCGSRKVLERAEILQPHTESAHAAATQAWLYSCSSCGHKWSEP